MRAPRERHNKSGANSIQKRSTEARWSALYPLGERDKITKRWTKFRPATQVWLQNRSTRLWTNLSLSMVAEVTCSTSCTN